MRHIRTHRRLHHPLPGRPSKEGMEEGRREERARKESSSHTLLPIDTCSAHSILLPSFLLTGFLQRYLVDKGSSHLANAYVEIASSIESAEDGRNRLWRKKVWRIDGWYWVRQRYNVSLIVTQWTSLRL